MKVLYLFLNVEPKLVSLQICSFTYCVCVRVHQGSNTGSYGCQGSILPLRYIPSYPCNFLVLFPMVREKKMLAQRLISAGKLVLVYLIFQLVHVLKQP